MKIPIKLAELLQQNEAAITAAKTFLSQKLAILDCTVIVTLTTEQLQIFSSLIPENCNLEQLTEIIDFSTVNDIFNHQIQEFINERLKIKNSSLSSPNTPISNFQFLDIFQFRNEVIGDYRQYIESFLKIRDPKVKEFVDKELDKGQLTLFPLLMIYSITQKLMELGLFWFIP